MTHAIELKKSLKLRRRSFKSFIFINDSSLEYDLKLTKQLHRNPNNHLLSQSKLGCQLKVEQIFASPHIILQLNNLQFQTSAQIRLLSKTDKASVIVELQGNLIGLGAEIARKIIVTPINEPQL